MHQCVVAGPVYANKTIVHYSQALGTGMLQNPEISSVLGWDGDVRKGFKTYVLQVEMQKL